MNRLMFVYLSGSEKGKTRIFTQNPVTIGTSDASDLKLVPEEGGVLPEGVVADVYDEGGTYFLVPHEDGNRLEFKINGEELPTETQAAGHPLRDGDTLQIGHGLSSASVLFQVMPENFSAASLVRQKNRGVQQVEGQPVHPLTATLFVKELTASLWAEIPRKAKLIGVLSFGLLFVAVLGIFYFGFLILHRNTSGIERLQAQNAVEQAQREQYQELIRKQQEEIERLRDVSEQTRRFTQRIAEIYSPGVCLIVGSYGFAERGTGRLLRYETADDANANPVDQNGNLLASVDGAGPPVQIEYTGTGFLVEEGVIATNKHVVQPWDSEQIAQLIMKQGGGFRPQPTTLVAFFPSIKTPFALKVLKTSGKYDIAMCRFEQGDAALPVLQPSTEDPRSIIGEPVVLLGYPTGVDGLLQRIEESERREILKEHGDSAEDVATGLAERGLVRPLTTTGTISDVLPTRIVHSAQTTEGGSGSPMLNRDGRVIAINSAILTTSDGTQSFGGSNFGVPIRVAFDLLHASDQGQGKLP